MKTKMREAEVSVRDLGMSQFLVSFGKFSFRVVVENKVSYIGLPDLAECCGYKAGSKFAVRATIPKVKLDARHLDGRKVGRITPMWFMTVDDAIQFVEERAVDDGFRKWFTGYADTIKNLSASTQPEQPVPDTPQPAQEQPKAPAEQPDIGVNISVELIDRIIVDLMALKESMSTS